jgi:hypothetical protein
MKVQVEVFQIMMSWRWRQHGPPKHWYPTISLHGVTIQKTTTWISIATPLTSPWRWRQHSTPKHLYPTSTLRGVTFQKSSTWIISLFHPEDGGSMALRNVGILAHHYTVSQRRKSRLKSSPPWKPQISLILLHFLFYSSVFSVSLLVYPHSLSLSRCDLSSNYLTLSFPRQTSWNTCN